MKLFSSGGIGSALAADWEETEKGFITALADLRATASTPNVVPSFSEKEKIQFVGVFQKFDKLLTQLRSFTIFEDKRIEDYGISQREYEDYAAHYRNIIEELRGGTGPGPGPDPVPEPGNVDTDYEPTAYGQVTIDYEYIISLIQNIVASIEDDSAEDFRSKIEEIREYISEFSKTNEKLGHMMNQILDGIEKDKDAYVGRNISEILSEMKHDVVNRIVDAFVMKWYVDRNAVLFAIENNRNGVIPNISNLRDSINYYEYKEASEEPLSKLKARSKMVNELEKIIIEEIIPLQIGVNY